MKDKYQPLDATVSKRIKPTIKKLLIAQLTSEVTPTVMKITQLISVIKQFHACWILKAYLFFSLYIFIAGTGLT